MTLFQTFEIRYRLPGAKPWEFHYETVAALSVSDALEKFSKYYGGKFIVTDVNLRGEVRI